MSTYLHIFFIVTLLFILLQYALKKQPSELKANEYVVSKRDLGIFSLTATLVMTEFNTATLIAFSSLGYVSGLKALTLPLVFLIGLLFYALVAAKKWKEFNGTSTVDYFIKQYGKTIGMISAIFLFTAMSGFSATYLKSLTILFKNFINLESEWFISAYLAIATLFMVIKKGLASIVKVDIIAFLIVIIALPFILYFATMLPTNFDNIKEIKIRPELLDNSFLLSLFPLTMFSYILAPWYGQRIFAAKNKTTAKIAVIFSAIFVFCLYSIGILISYTLAIKVISFADPQESFPYALNQVMSGKFSYIGYSLLFLISSTTLTGLWNAMATMSLEFKQTKSVNSYVIMMFICAVITYILTNVLVDNILSKMILANIPVVSLSFALLSGFYISQKSRTGVYVSIIIGLLSGIGSYLYFGDAGNYTYYWAMIGIPVMFIVGIVGVIHFPDKKTLNNLSSQI